MLKRRRARVFIFLCFAFFLTSFMDASLSPASAQEVSPTPVPLIPPIFGGQNGGTQGGPSTQGGTSIPELPTVGPVSVSYPIHGQTLEGIVNITGVIALEGWTSYELAFSYADSAATGPLPLPAGDNATLNWFPFATGTNPVSNNLLSAWDTTLLTDNDYNIRLRVFSPGAFQDVFVYGLRVRNYTVDTPAPTPTFTATSTPSASPTATITPTFTPLPTSTPYSTPTPLPPNPLSLGADEIVFNLARGALFTALLFGIFGLFLRMRRR